MFKLGVQEGATQSAVTRACPRPVAKSLLHVGDVSRATSGPLPPVVEPFVGDLRVAQVFDPHSLLPGSFAEERVLQAPGTRPISGS